MLKVNKMPKRVKLVRSTPAVSDCLETLEEITMEANHEFKENGE
jgi:ferrochelatase